MDKDLRELEEITFGILSEKEIKELAQIMRTQYSSCLWKKGDILLIDNKKVMHAGMPGKGERVIRAMICNPVAMNYSLKEPGCIQAQEHVLSTIGEYMKQGLIPQTDNVRSA